MKALPTPEDLDASPVWSVIRVAHLLERRVTAIFGVHALTPVQFGVLAYLAASGPLTTAELARCVLVRPQSIAGVIATLDDRGLVHRPGPRGRGRSSPVHLATAGEELLAAVWPSFTEANTAQSLGIGPDQLELLPEMMHALLTGLDEPSVPR